MIALANTTASGPIVVNHVGVQATEDGAGPGFLSLAFENTSNVTATEVIFEFSGDAYFQRIDDVGTFTPGVSIKHAFLDDSSSPVQKVRVAEVDFADGTTWTNNQTTGPRLRRQATWSSVSALLPF
jgi:hypothetical protein